MKKTVCLISLGSNTDGDRYLGKAREELKGFFPDVRYGEACQTFPVGMHNPSLFLNQIAVFRTYRTVSEVKRILKEIELACTAIPKDKQHERIYIDIDLLRFGENILKSEDWKRSYVQEGFAGLLLGSE